MERSRVSRRDTERMQNELKATSAGTVGKVWVTGGATGEVGIPLVTMVAAKE